MRRILFYCTHDRNGTRGDPASLLADLVEFATRTHASNASDIELGVVAPVDICFLVGLTMLGRSSARTVEAGDRHESPLRVYPYFAINHRSAALNALTKLHELGAMENMSKDDGLLVSETERSALDRAMQDREWTEFVLLSPDGALEPFLAERRWRERLSVRQFTPSKRSPTEFADVTAIDPAAREDWLHGGEEALDFMDLLQRLELPR